MPGVPNDCCSDLWWCGTGGPFEWPVGNPPSDYTGGPYRDETKAVFNCPVPPIAAVCGSTHWDIPAVVYVTLSDQTGSFVGELSENSYALVVTDQSGVFFSAGGSLVVPGKGGRQWILRVYFHCDIYDRCDVGENGTLVVGFTMGVSMATPPACGGTGPLTSPWEEIGAGASAGSAVKCVAAGGTPVSTTGEEVISAFSFGCHDGFNGATKVSLSS